MSDNIAAARAHANVFDKICYKLGWGRGTMGAIRKRARWVASGTPAVDAGSQATYPVAASDLAYDYTNGYAYVCTVAPTANTAATFVKLHA